MGKLTAAAGKGKFPQAGQPQPQAPSTYPEDDLGSGAGYLGTAPAPPSKKPMMMKSKKKVHAPGKRGGGW